MLAFDASRPPSDVPFEHATASRQRRDALQRIQLAEGCAIIRTPHPRSSPTRSFLTKVAAMLPRAFPVFRLCIACIFLSSTLVSISRANEPWEQGLRFYASFDENANADWASGDSQALTAATLKREQVTPGL